MYRPSLLQKGFTLIELLVVIAIIGILATVALAALDDARSLARDTQRRAELYELQKALELYYNKNGTYAVAGGGWRGNGQGWAAAVDGSVGGNYPRAVTEVLYSEGYLSAPIVEDPVQQYGYMIYLCAPNIYAISATLENPSEADIAKIQTTCNGVGSNGTYSRYGKNYAVTNE